MKAQNLPALIIHAPHYQVAANNRRSYEKILESGIGTGYAISRTESGRIEKGCKVILLRQDRNRRRAEGTLVCLKSTGQMAGNGIPRYNVEIKGLKECAYVAEALNRRGVNVI